MTLTSQNTTTPSVSLQAIFNALNWRYATKQFDPSKKLSPQQWTALEQVLLLPPSSYGIEPWKFVVITDPVLRSQLQPATYNQPQVVECSHFVVFAAKRRIEESDVQEFIEFIAKERGMETAELEQFKQMMMDDLVNGPRSRMAFEWSTRQCYLALGFLLESAALIGIDACPMEGFDPATYDQILNLEAMGYGAVACCALGFRSPEDKYAQLKKVRFPAEKIIVKR